MKTKEHKMTVGKWIINKVDTKDWRAGKRDQEKQRHFKHGGTSANVRDTIREMMETVGGRADFISQVNELEREGFITVERTNVNTEIKKITFAVKEMDRLCDYEGVVNWRKLIEEKKAYLSDQIENAGCEWLANYEMDVYRRLLNGTLDKNVMDENIFKILSAIVALEKDVWKRKFSSDILKNSKTFEDVYQDKIITILRKYSDKADESMTADEVLMEHGIVTYSQNLQFKGGITYNVGGADMDTSVQIYGTVLNAQTLSHASLVSLNAVKRIMTIENQANYEQMTFQPDVLYIYTHGFLSPKERRFLDQIEQAADSTVEFYHWSDLDYGGIRIFQFMKQNVFRRVKPYKMDRVTYDRVNRLGEGSVLEEEKRRKLEKLYCEELEELKQCILANGKEYEQEMLIE